MSIQLTFIEEADYLLVEATGGAWGTRDGVETILSISARAKKKGYKRILVDRRNLADPVTEFARFEAGRTIAKEFPPLFRFAAVYRPEDLAKLGEDAAVNRGATAAAFSDMELARQWLLEDPSASPSGPDDTDLR